MFPCVHLLSRFAAPQIALRYALPFRIHLLFHWNAQIVRLLFNVCVHSAKTRSWTSFSLWFHQQTFVAHFRVSLFLFFYSLVHRVFPPVNKRLDDTNVHEVQTNLYCETKTLITCTVHIIWLLTWQPCLTGSFQFFFQSKYHFYSFSDVHFHVPWLIVQFRCGWIRGIIMANHAEQTRGSLKAMLAASCSVYILHKWQLENEKLKKMRMKSNFNINWITTNMQTSNILFKRIRLICISLSCSGNDLIFGIEERD